jgi:hypothetical protein
VLLEMVVLEVHHLLQVQLYFMQEAVEAVTILVGVVLVVQVVLVVVVRVVVLTQDLSQMLALQIQEVVVEQAVYLAMVQLVVMVLL